MGNTKNTGYLQNIVQYDASNNITLPANLTVTGVITGYATTSYVGTQLGGYVPTTRTISINGTSLDLSANRSFTINSMVYPGAGIAVSTGTAWGTSLTDNSSNWNTAFGWGNHAGLYSLLNHTHTFASLTSKPTTLVGYGITDAATSAQGTSADTAYGWGNHAIAGYLTGITSGQVTTALGFTPYNATNPSGYITTAALSTYATESYVGIQIANLVASSPAALDTLNELAAALGNDAAFSTTVSTALGNRLRVDINTQGLSATLQGYGRTNLGLGTAATANTGDFVAYRTFGTAANSATGDFVAYRTFGTAANNNTGDFALASHTHSIADVTGLQTALDGKQASGSYAAATHSHIISDVTGLQTALDGKQASLGYTPYNSTNPSGYITSSALSSYLPLTGGSLTGNLTFSTQGSKIIFGDSTSGSPSMMGEGLVNTEGTDSDFLTIYARSSLRIYTTATNERARFDSNGLRVYGTIIKDGGTSAQILAADGSVLTAGTNITISGGTISSTSGGGTDATKLPLAGGTMTGQITWSGGTAPISFQQGGNTGTYTQTTIYANQNNTSGNTANGIFIERGYTDTSNTEIRHFVIGVRGGGIQWKLDGVGNVTQSGGLTSSGSIVATNFSLSGGANYFDATNATYTNKATFRSNWSGAGIWGLGSTTGHTLKFDQISGTNDWAGATDLELYLGTKLVLNSSNYTSYSPTLTGGSASGTWGINITGAQVMNTTAVAENDAFPGFNQTASYIVTSSTGGGDGYIQSWRWTGGGYVTQFYTDVDPTGIFSLRQRDSVGTWGSWYRLLHSGNFTSYALATSGGTITGKTMLSSGGYFTGASGSGFRWNSADDAYNNVIMNDDGSMWVRSWVAVNGNTRISSGTLSVRAGGAAGVGWSTGLNIGDSSNYTGFIQDAGVSRWRNFGSGNWDWFNSAASVMIMSLSNAGAFTASGDITAYSSDKRLKDNIVNIPNSLEKVLSLNGVTFDWNDTAINNGFTPSIRYGDSGVIAQEVQAVLPQAVKHAPFDKDKNGNSKSGENYLTVQYEKLVPLFIEAIKELKAENDAQKSEIDELKDLVKQLINR